MRRGVHDGRKTHGSPNSPKVTVRAHASAPGAVESQVQFRNSANEKLVGSFVNVANSQHLVILCHGYASSKDFPLMVQLARELALKKLSSLRFDFSGNGESEGVFTFSNYIKEVNDLRAAVLFVRESLRKTVLAVTGHSKGGNVVLLYGAAHDDVPYIVNVAGRYDMKRGFRERFGEETIAKVEKLGQVQQQTVTDTGAPVKFMLTKQDIEERMSMDMQESARKITISEVLTVHGTQDQVIPVSDAHSFAHCIRQHQLFLVDGADHNFKVPQHADACVKKVVDYLHSGLL